MKDKNCLLIIDLQNDFCQGGSLAVPKAEESIQKVNEIREKFNFDFVAHTQDSHPLKHVSFATTHQQEPFTYVTLENGKQQKLWPQHCVANTKGSEFHKDLKVLESDIILQKGFEINVDSYSGFKNERGDKTKLDDILKEKGVNEIYVCGVALEHCVFKTCMDGKNLGYSVKLILDASRGISEKDCTLALEKLKKEGVEIINSNEIKI